MPLRIIPVGEVFTITVDEIGSTFQFKRPTPFEESVMYDAISETLEREPRVRKSLEVIQKTMVGWTGVLLEGDTEAPFAPELIEQLPWLVILNLALHVALGGQRLDPMSWRTSAASKTGSNGKSPTTG